MPADHLEDGGTQNLRMFCHTCSKCCDSVMNHEFFQCCAQRTDFVVVLNKPPKEETSMSMRSDVGQHSLVVYLVDFSVLI